MIPPRIIQIGAYPELSLRQRGFIANVKGLNPDFDWCFFDERGVHEFIDREYPQYRAIFDAFAFPIQRYDFFRYLAVYRLGGFYFDLDVLLASSLASLMEHDCVFPFEGLTLSTLLREHGMDWEVGNYAFGAAAGHPFLAAVIDNCVRAHREPAWVAPMLAGVPWLSKQAHSILYTTGPGLVSRTLAESPRLAEGVTVLFPEDVCNAETWNRFGTFGVHISEGTWRPPTSFIRRRVEMRWEAMVLRRVLEAGRRRGKTRTLRTVASVHV
jgi:mannosyltransferase OCH1-like enzyme